jgi:two-component system phosphate regulon sensor histidine kinase PhoR
VKLGFRGKLFVGSVAMILISTVIADVYYTRAVDELVTQRTKDDMLARLVLASSLASADRADLNDVTHWHAKAHEMGALARSRVSIIRKDGVLVGDSSLNAAELAAAENHATREEVIAALSGRVGSSARPSATVHMNMLYVAAPLQHEGTVLGAVRLAIPLTDVVELQGRVHAILLWSTLIALVVAVVLSGAASLWAGRRSRLLAAAARRMAAGDLSTRTHTSGDDEFSELGHALDRLAENLSSTLHELRSERDVQSGILASMQEGVLLLDGAGRIALVNPALRQMLLLGADTVGRRPEEIVEDPELASLLDKARTTHATAIGEIELVGLKPRRLLVRALAMSGNPGGLLAVLVDVTELRRLEKLRRDFVANVSHELRTPVTAIRSATETLQDAARNDPQAVPMFIDIIERNAERMRQLVEDLLDLSKIESREYKLDLEPVELPQAVVQAFALFRERANKKRISLLCEVGDVVPPVHADRRALEQILSNLLENAIKYCAEDTAIRVSATSERERYVRLTVADSGPGIEAKHLPRLFERFYRVDKGRARDVGGTGLGLSIVKHLAEAMGGEVGVDSILGKGSTFWVNLPIAGATVSMPPPVRELSQLA